jgi:NADH-quinone oxidoreductase subunit G
MATVYVNDQPVDIGDARLNLIQAAERAGVLIPRYCWHPDLSVVASCRMCLVETGERKPDGTVAMLPRVVPGCQTAAKDGTVVVTGEYGQNGPNTKRADLKYPDGYTPGVKAKKSQADTLEGILINHPLDCPVCDKAGECLLQDYSFRFGYARSRMIDAKNIPPNKPDLGPNVALFTDRCVMCTRCVRFTREFSGEAELQVIHRGHHAEIDIFQGDPIDNKLATNVVDLCPVGALASKDFLYTQRVWNLKTVDSVCPDCSTGCSIHLDYNKNIAYRLRPRENPQAQGHFMCDDGRLGYHYVNDPKRLRHTLVRKDGKQVPVLYLDAVKELRQELTDLAKQDGGVAGVLSPYLTCEEAYLLAKFLKSLSGQAQLFLGPVPVVGEDDTYPKDRRGRPTDHVRFTIRAEKAPNRRGVEEVLRHFQGEVLSFAECVKATGRLKAIYLTAAYPPRAFAWIDEGQAEALKKVPTLVVQDLFPSAVSAAAKYVVPATTFAEKDGTFVNHAGLAQGIRHATNPAGEVRTDGQVFLDLAERRGLIHAPSLRKELAQEVPYFAGVLGGTGELGVMLEQQ